MNEFEQFFKDIIFMKIAMYRDPEPKAGKYPCKKCGHSQGQHSVITENCSHYDTKVGRQNCCCKEYIYSKCPEYIYLKKQLAMMLRSNNGRAWKIDHRFEYHRCYYGF
jgi:hypothetical protein